VLKHGETKSHLILSYLTRSWLAQYVYRPHQRLVGLEPGALGLVVGLYRAAARRCTAARGLAREAATATATAKWRQMGVRSVHEVLGIYTHDVHFRWGSVFWRSTSGRAVGARDPRPHARHWAAERRHPSGSPRPAARGYAHGREAVGGADAWPQRCTPASCAGHARRQACERRAAGWRPGTG
jgi:hypothetical protein